jgi:hypothetical protein
MVLAPTKATNSQGGTGQTTASGAATGGLGAVPFPRAANQHREAFANITTALGTSSVALAPLLIPAYGYLRSVLLRVTLTGTGGAPVIAADGPYACLADVTLQEPNGNPIVQFNGNGGHNLYLANKWGGYRGNNEPKQWQGYSGTAAAQVAYIRIPLEISEREALGALPNQNSSAQFQVRINLATLANSYATAPTSATVQVEAFTEAWDQPAPMSPWGPNQTEPPAMNTTQFWTQTSYSITSGQQTIQLRRVGNLLRNVIFVWRTAAGVRSEAGFPATWTFSLDAQQLDIVDNNVFLEQQSERFGYFGTADTAGAPDTGVRVMDFIHDFSGRGGYETRNQWLYTLPSSRFEISGNFQASGVLYVLTNDVILKDNVFAGGA